MSAAVPVLEACALDIGHGQRRVGQDISLAMAPGEVLCLLGPNGSGKTTLFRTLLGLLAPLAGEVRVLGEPVAAWSRSAFARHVGYVPQDSSDIFREAIYATTPRPDLTDPAVIYQGGGFVKAGPFG